MEYFQLAIIPNNKAVFVIWVCVSSFTFSSSCFHRYPCVVQFLLFSRRICQEIAEFLRSIGLYPSQSVFRMTEKRKNLPDKVGSSPRCSSLLRSRFLGCHATLPPKKRLLTSEPHSFPFVFVVCLRSVEQTNHM